MPSAATVKRMWALDSPTFTLDKSILMVGATGEVTIPMPAYLIEHPKGLVLFDTGLVPAAATDPQGVYGPLSDMLGLHFPPDLALDAQLGALGYKTTDVTHVIASHTHFDHTGGLYLFPDAQFFVGEGDMRFGFWPDPVSSVFFRQADIEPLRGLAVREVPGVDHDVFGDGSIVILFTPGHTPGELSLLVRLPDRNFILTGDTVHLREALTAVAPMPYDADVAQSLRSIRRLNLLKDSADATIWISHDPEDWAEFGHAPHCFE